MKAWKLFVIVAVGIVGIGSAGFVFMTMSSEAEVVLEPTANIPTSMPVVKILKTDTDNGAVVVNIRGKIVSDGNVKLTASVPAIVKEVLFTQGKMVKKGDVLMHLGAEGSEKHALELAYEQAITNEENLQRTLKNTQGLTAISVQQANQQGNALDANLAQLQRTLELTQNAGQFTVQGAQIGLQNLQNSLARTQSLHDRNFTQLDLTGDQAQESAAVQAQNTALSVLTSLKGGYIPLVAGIYDVTQDTTFRDYKHDLQDIADQLEEYKDVSARRLEDKLPELISTVYDFLNKNEAIASDIVEITNVQAKPLVDALRQATATATNSLTIAVTQLTATKNQLESLPNTTSIQRQTLDAQVASIADQMHSLQLSIEQATNGAELQAQALKAQIESLRQQKISAGLGVDAAKAAAKSQVDSVSGQLNLVAKQVEQAKNALDQLQITSPIDGYIVDVPVNTGESVSVGKELATVYATNILFVRATIAPSDREKIHVHDTADLAVSTTQTVGKVGAEIIRIAPVADANGQIPVDLAFLPTDLPAAFVPGITVQGQIKVKDGVRDVAIQVPLNAVVLENNQSFVFIYTAGYVKKLPVSLGPSSGDYVLIVSGITTGDKIIVSAPVTLQDGMEVTLADD